MKTTKSSSSASKSSTAGPSGTSGYSKVRNQSADKVDDIRLPELGHKPTKLVLVNSSVELKFTSGVCQFMEHTEAARNFQPHPSSQFVKLHKLITPWTEEQLAEHKRKLGQTYLKEPFIPCMFPPPPEFCTNESSGGQMLKNDISVQGNGVVSDYQQTTNRRKSRTSLPVKADEPQSAPRLLIPILRRSGQSESSRKWISEEEPESELESDLDSAKGNRVGPVLRKKTTTVKLKKN